MSMCYGDVIQIDPQLLALSATQTILNRFELCSYTPALFSGMQFRKPVLANALSFCLFNCLWVLSMC